jgi:excisionase family DNA binding protein
MRHLLTTHEVATALGVSAKHVSRLRAKGLQSIRLGQLVRYRPEDVEEYIRSHAQAQS